MTRSSALPGPISIHLNLPFYIYLFIFTKRKKKVYTLMVEGNVAVYYLTAKFICKLSYGKAILFQ
jgi:hypothetical protein